MKVFTDFSVSSRPMRIGRKRSEAAVFATGGTETVVTQEGLFYRVHTFHATGTLVVSIPFSTSALST